MAWTKAQVLPFVNRTVTVIYGPAIAITIWPPPPPLRVYGVIGYIDDVSFDVTKSDQTMQKIMLDSVVEIKEGIVTGEEAITTTQAGLFGDLLKNPWAIAALALGGILAYQTWGQKPKKAK